MIKFLLVTLLLINSYAEINIITDRSEFHLRQIINDFEKETGEQVNVFYTKQGLLIPRAKVGNYDVIISKNSSEIAFAKKQGLLKMLPSSIYHDLDVNYKDEDFTWFNLSYRIRAFYVKKDMKDPPMTYYDLADPRYRGKICIRKHTHNYNLDMYGYLLAEMGQEKFIKWFKKFNSNLAKKPSGNDRNQIKNIYLGECEIAIVNTYYMGLMMQDPKQKEWLKSGNLIIPNQQKSFSNNLISDFYQFNEKGAIAIFSSVAILKHAKNNPEKFLKYLISSSVQKKISENNFEYPLNSENISKIVNNFSNFQNLEFKDIKIRPHLRDDLYILRKKVYKIIKTIK